MNDQQSSRKAMDNKVNDVLLVCASCQRSFPSKNALFHHLRLNKYNCLRDEDFHYLSQAKYAKEEKIAILYGYRVGQRYIREASIVELSQVHYSMANNTNNDEGNTNSRCWEVFGGESAAQLVMEAIQIVGSTSRSTTSSSEVAVTSSEKGTPDDVHVPMNPPIRTNRSYGCASRHTDIVAQDDHTSACTEVLTVRVPALLVEKDQKEELETSIQDWIRNVNQVLQNLLSPKDASSKVRMDRGSVIVFGRLPIPGKFNAELDVTSRKMEYLLPLDFFFDVVDKFSLGSPELTNNTNKTLAYCHAFPSFRAGHCNAYVRPATATLHLLTFLKKIMQRFATHIEELDVSDTAAVMEKTFSSKKLEKRGLLRSKNIKNTKKLAPNKHQSILKDHVPKDNPINQQRPAYEHDKDKGNAEKRAKKVNVLRRKRYHNFTPNVMAHEFLAFRRMDRFHHSATERFDGVPDNISGGRPFLLLSLSGDLFLTGQVQGIVGLLIAICKGVIDEDILDCIFDETYTPLVPAPVAPYFGIISKEANYVTWEGKVKAILTPRKVTGVDQNMWGGWRSEELTDKIDDFYSKIKRDIAISWTSQGFGPIDGRLMMEKRWVKEVLDPWAAKAVDQLADYRRWKASKIVEQKFSREAKINTVEEDEISTTFDAEPSLKVAHTEVPELFAKVLQYLREADASGLWPKTTPKRQLVMVSSSKSGESPNNSLAQSYMQAKANRINEKHSSAYSFVEGQGGASGSFSLGAMPGVKCEQPRANNLFPELMKAAFELEIALNPARASSTIAVNRNAQFRPHTDSGAGSGQSTSLIVGLGNYVGGELVVEGVTHDIKYKPMEFNGWTQRHWTLGFSGERYSLVWFTPKGCEGIRGIDLCS